MSSPYMYCMSGIQEDDSIVWRAGTVVPPSLSGGYIFPAVLELLQDKRHCVERTLWASSGTGGHFERDAVLPAAQRKSMQRERLTLLTCHSVEVSCLT